MPSRDDRERADAAAETLLLLYEAMGVRAVVLIEDASRLLVLHQAPADVLPLCQRVIKEYEVPADRSLQ